MAIEARIRELGVRHQHLERAIEDELRRPMSDSFRLLELKRQKLRLKEEIEIMRRERGPIPIGTH
ncbi:MAG: YdcH family protein [Caulobacteraceae bacterium]